MKLNAGVLFTDIQAACDSVWTEEAFGKVLTSEARARILTRFGFGEAGIQQGVPPVCVRLVRDRHIGAHFTVEGADGLQPLPP